MSVWLVTPTFSYASLRVILIVSLAVKLACIVSIYRLHHHRAMYWMHEVCCLGPCLAGRVPPASLGQVPAAGWRASLVHYRPRMAALAGECPGRLVLGAHPGTMMATDAAAPVGPGPQSQDVPLPT